jgi:hypothetical protein
MLFTQRPMLARTASRGRGQGFHAGADEDDASRKEVIQRR